MKKIIFILTSLLISNYTVAQVNRYTKPAPSATYSPMTFEELKFAPSNKRAAADANFKILQKIAFGMAEYIEKRGSDDELLDELAPLYKQLEQLYTSDLSNKRPQLVKINDELSKAFRKYELRDSKKGDENYFQDNSGLFKIKKGAVIVAEPIFTSLTEAPEGLGLAESGTVKILKNANSDFFEVEYKGKKGYISKKFVQIN